MPAAALLFAALLAAETPSAAEEDARAQTAGDAAARTGAGVAPVELIPRLELRQSFAQQQTIEELDVDLGGGGADGAAAAQLREIGRAHV